MDSQIDGLRKALKKNRDGALEFIDKLDLTLNSFEKSGNLKKSYVDIKKAILDYKDKIIEK